MDKQLIDILKYIKRSGSLDPKIIKSLSLEDRELIENLYNQGLIDEALQFIDTIDKEHSWKQLKSRFRFRKPLRQPMYLNIIKYAAIFIFLFGMVLFFTNTLKEEKENIIVADESIELILENGDIQKLSIQDSKQITLTNGQVVGSQKGAELNYAKGPKLKTLVYNELKIPNGKRFNITLSDGTVVYLNAGSSLRYPVNFIAGNSREVFLEGEGYFDVAKDKTHSFIVHTNDMNVKVLGTSFNVSSYKNNDVFQTVLVEGSVALYNDKRPTEKSLLKPGYKAEWSKQESRMAISEVDTNRYTGWIHGDVVFRKTPFKKMIENLERSYDVTIINKNEDLNNLNVNASFNVNIESISDIMTFLSEMKSFTYTISNNIIIIK